MEEIVIHSIIWVISDFNIDFFPNHELVVQSIMASRITVLHLVLLLKSKC